MRVAITHDWLVGIGGAERVLDHLLLCFPGADVYTTVDFLPREQRHVLRGARVFPSFLQRMPFARGRHWDYLPLMPLAMEQFDLTAYDLVVSNSHAVAKGVVTGPEQVHVSYVLSPMRFAWDLQAQYLREFRMERGVRSCLARGLLYHLRQWDHGTAARVDRMLAVSRYIARRAEVCYGRGAEVVYPPVEVDFYTPGGEAREDFYLAASRMTPFKRIDLLVEAFSGMPRRRLVVIGDGPEYRRIRAAAGPNVTFLGYRDDAVLRDHLRRARAFVFAAPEDFGLVMVEAQACGTPVIALGRGGALEIVRGLDDPHPTGAFFPEQTAAAVRAAVEAFEREEDRVLGGRCRENAERFAPAAFRERFVALAEEALRHPGRGRARGQ